jgi:hypothetical protein
LKPSVIIGTVSTEFEGIDVSQCCDKFLTAGVMIDDVHRTSNRGCDNVIEKKLSILHTSVT